MPTVVDEATSRGLGGKPDLTVVSIERMSDHKKYSKERTPARTLLEFGFYVCGREDECLEFGRRRFGLDFDGART